MTLTDLLWGVIKTLISGSQSMSCTQNSNHICNYCLLLPHCFLDWSYLSPHSQMDFSPQTRFPVLSISDLTTIPEKGWLSSQEFLAETLVWIDQMNCFPANNIQIFTAVPLSSLEKVKVHRVKLPLLTLYQIKNTWVITKVPRQAISTNCYIS